MSDFEYYEKEPKKSGRGFLIAALMIVAIAVAGVLVVQYILPYVDDSDTKMSESKIEMEVATTPETEEVQETQQLTEAMQTQQKAITYIQGNVSIPDIVEDVSPSVVGVLNYVKTEASQGFGDQNEASEVPQGSGSGVIISEDGYIVTNHHVVQGASRVTVTLTTGEEVTAEVVGSDQYVDLAVLKIDKTNLDFITFGNSSDARAGELAIAIGYPLTDDFSTTTVTAGILSAVGVNVEVEGINFEMLQTDAPINPGNSGGALVDGTGQLIGINTLKTIYAGSTEFGGTISAEGIGYAIPSHVVEPIVSELKEYGEVVRPFIGIAGRVISEENSKNLELPQGMYIDELTSDAPAEVAGILVGDIITHVEDIHIVAFEDLYTFILSSEVGDEVIFTVFRSETGETLKIKVKLASTIDFK